MIISRIKENQLRTIYLKKSLSHKGSILSINALVCVYMVLMVAWFAFFFYVTMARNWDSMNLPKVHVPTAIHGNCTDWEPLTVFIKSAGEIHFRGKTHDDLERIPLLLTDTIDRAKFDKTRVKLQVDRLAPFGKVQAFLRAAQKAGIREFCFITVPRAGLIDFMGRERLNWRKK